MGIFQRYIKKLICFAALAIATGADAFAQDPAFTQFYANPLYLNPAFAGTARCPRTILNYRNEWPGVETTAGKTFITYSASFDKHIDAIAGGIGMLVTNDRAGIGTLNTTTASFIYSYQLPVTRTFSIKAGAQATYWQSQLDWSKLTFGDMIDPRRGFVFNTNEVPITDGVKTVDFSAGVLGFSKKYYFGLATHHLTQPDISLTQDTSGILPLKITGHAGAVIPIDDLNTTETSISPNILYNKQGTASQINFGMYYNRGPFVVGLWYRHAGSNKDAAAALVGLQSSTFKFGYSYDITISQLGAKSAGSHEISFGIQFECKPKKKKFRTISCPSF